MSVLDVNSPSGQRSKATLESLFNDDKAHIWHPYAKIENDSPLFCVESAQGVYLNLASGEQLIDGMSSWWSVLHGYNHPELNKALNKQLEKMAHVMFGGLTHEPAVTLAKRLVDITPTPLQRVFFSDSGSVAVEVAMKMAIQYWQSLGQARHRFLTLSNGYHGDTFAAMSVCDPITGMHHVFKGALSEQIFAPRPEGRFGEAWNAQEFTQFEQLITKHKNDIAGVILEPIVQGTGGMHFYSADYLKAVREITSQYSIPLIADEIATGLGRTKKLFACEHADIEPDILCLGKTLSAGYITLAATLCTNHIAETICAGEAGVFMHGPTYMANPLACAVANRSLDLLFDNDWFGQVSTIENNLQKHLSDCDGLPFVKEVRVLGGIGVIEMKENIDIKKLQPALVRHGVWLRPFGRLLYTIPPLVITEKELTALCEGIKNALNEAYK